MIRMIYSIHVDQGRRVVKCQDDNGGQPVWIQLHIVSVSYDDHMITCAAPTASIGIVGSSIGMNRTHTAV